MAYRRLYIYLLDTPTAKARWILTSSSELALPGRAPSSVEVPTPSALLRDCPFIPPQFELVCVLPGKTVGGIYASHYGAGSVLEYSELIVVAGLVSYSSQIGGWVSHIYVDNADSVAGGRNIWGLPKELAEFTWEKNNSAHSASKNRLRVRQGERTLCHFSYNSPNFELQLPLSANAFSTKSDSIVLFTSQAKSRPSIVETQLQIPHESSFANLGLDHPWLTLSLNQLRLVVGSPEAVGLREPVVSQL